MTRGYSGCLGKSQADLQNKSRSSRKSQVKSRGCSGTSKSEVYSGTSLEDVQECGKRMFGNMARGYSGMSQEDIQE